MISSSFVTLRWLLIVPLIFSACLSDRSFSDNPLVEARPYLSAAPSETDGTPLPLIIALHGFGGTGLSYGNNFGLQDLVGERGFVLVAPDGEDLPSGDQAWSISCCDETLQTADDVAYLRAVVEDISARYEIDPDRIYVVGYSNGGFMAYLLACQASDLIAAISVQAGSMIEGEELECEPEEPVAVMHVHGTADTHVAPEGGTLEYGLGPVNYLPIQNVIDFWLQRNACSEISIQTTTDYDESVDGSETELHRYTECSSNKTVTYGEMAQSTHEPLLTVSYTNAVIDFLLAHSK